jgi:hypothetical protein
MNEYGTLVETYGQEKIKVFREKPAQCDSSHHNSYVLMDWD